MTYLGKLLILSMLIGPVVVKYQGLRRFRYSSFGDSLQRDYSRNEKKEEDAFRSSAGGFAFICFVISLKFVALAICICLKIHHRYTSRISTESQESPRMRAAYSSSK